MHISRLVYDDKPMLTVFLDGLSLLYIVLLYITINVGGMKKINFYSLTVFNLWKYCEDNTEFP
jgi:hypothetical protein